MENTKKIGEKLKERWKLVKHKYTIFLFCRKYVCDSIQVFLLNRGNFNKGIGFKGVTGP